MGRADQAAKVKGMFIRPEQVAELSRRLEGAGRIRVEIDREDEADRMTVKIEATGLDAAAVEALLPDILKLRGRAVICPPGSLPNDGKVIDDLRSYDTGVRGPVDPGCPPMPQRPGAATRRALARASASPVGWAGARPGRFAALFRAGTGWTA